MKLIYSMIYRFTITHTHYKSSIVYKHSTDTEHKQLFTYLNFQSLKSKINGQKWYKCANN